ncbi:MAG: hypothetical protein QNJ13_09500 [Paracoccaceae bacterium]|nr:hypothetical protein [Paracoccaceae bacterium]
MADTPQMSPEEGANAIVALIGDIADATVEGDLDRIETILDRMEGIVAETGVEMPGLADRVAAIKGQSVRAKRHFENTDAALWAGDLRRAEVLSTAGPSLDLAALHGETWTESAIEADPTIEAEDDLADDADFNLADFAASLGLDPTALAGADDDDLYADIAEGAPGAIDALIASGADLNAPSGPAQHTPLLAALDAPGRSADDVAKLIAAGANPRVIHAQGDNAVSWAMGYHHPDTVTPESERALIARLADHGADVNHAIPGQMTAIQRAVLQAGPVQVAALLAAGADQTVDIFEHFVPEKLAGVTLVAFAAPKPDVLRVLLDHGADAARPDARGRRPVDFVRVEAEAAWNRVDPDDGWTIDHAEALEISLGMLERHLGL